MGISKKQEQTEVIIRVRMKRLSLGLSQKFVAQKLGISQHGYSKLELGYSQLTVGQLLMLLEVFEAEAYELVGYVDSELLTKGNSEVEASI